MKDIEAANERLEETINARADFQKQQADEEQQLHECLDAAYRIDQACEELAWLVGEGRYRTLRQDLETVARYAQVLQYLHKPLR